jgi:hypothetical protein
LERRRLLDDRSLHERLVDARRRGRGLGGDRIDRRRLDTPSLTLETIALTFGGGAFVPRS